METTKQVINEMSLVKDVVTIEKKTYEIANDSMNDGTKRSICKGDYVEALEMDYNEYDKESNPMLCMVIGKEDTYRACRKVTVTDRGTLKLEPFNSEFESVEVALCDVSLERVKRVTKFINN